MRIELDGIEAGSFPFGEDWTEADARARRVKLWGATADAALAFLSSRSTRSVKMVVTGFGLSRASYAAADQFARALASQQCTVRRLWLADPSLYLMGRVEADVPERLVAFGLRLEPEPAVPDRAAEEAREFMESRHDLTAVSAAYLLRSSRALEYFELDGGGRATVGPRAVNALADAVRDSPTLKTFIMRGCASPTATAAEETALVAALAASRSIRKISIEGGSLGHVPRRVVEAAAARAEAAAAEDDAAALLSPWVVRDPAAVAEPRGRSASIAQRAVRFLVRGRSGVSGGG